MSENDDLSSGRLLDRITLTCEKSRYGLSGRIEYRYAGGKMLRVQGDVQQETTHEKLTALLMTRPGITGSGFEKEAEEQRVTREAARSFLKKGALAGTVRIEHQGRKNLHFWVGPKPAVVEDART